MARGVFLAVISILNFWYSQSFHCNSNCGPDGLFPEKLPAVSIPVSELSQCTRPQFCDDSTPSTGHQLVLEQNLTEAAISVEQCYSLCFDDTSETTGEEGCPQLEEYMCFSACTLLLPTLENATQESLTMACRNLCSADTGNVICEKAFPEGYKQSCSEQCSMSCMNSCSVLVEKFPNSTKGSIPSINKTTLQLSYSDDLDQKRKGVMKYVISGPNSSVTLGVIWKVTIQSETYYISQHLPLLLNQTEVGTLYRIGSNLLAVQQFQCLPDVMLSYALVNKYGISQFSQPTEQCFLGNWFPAPPTGIQVEFGFVESTADLRLGIKVENLSTDDALAEGYGVQVFRKRNNVLSLTNAIQFPNREDLDLNIATTAEVESFLPEYGTNEANAYVLAVYSLPQRNMSLSGRQIFPASSGVAINITAPDFHIINGNISYTVVRDPTSGRANLTVTYTVLSGWKSLVPIESVMAILTPQEIRDFGFGPIPFPISGYTYTSLVNIAPSDMEIIFTFENVIPSYDSEEIKFQATLNRRFQSIHIAIFLPGSLINPVIPALQPSLIRGLRVCIQALNGTYAAIEAAWYPPSRPQGMVTAYEFQVKAGLQDLILANEELMTNESSAVISHNTTFDISNAYKTPEEEMPLQVRVRAISITYDAAKSVQGEWVEFDIQLKSPLQPSLIRGLRVCIQALNGTYAAIEAAWYPPSRPQGMVTAYEFQVKAGLQDLILANEELMTNESSAVISHNTTFDISNAYKTPEEEMPLQVRVRAISITCNAAKSVQGEWVEFDIQLKSRPNTIKQCSCTPIEDKSGLLNEYFECIQEGSSGMVLQYSLTWIILAAVAMLSTICLMQH